MRRLLDTCRPSCYFRTQPCLHCFAQGMLKVGANSGTSAPFYFGKCTRCPRPSSYLGFTVRHLWEDAGSGLVSLNDHVLVELGGIEANAFIEGRPLVVIQVHGDIDGQAEELAPLAALPVIQELGLRLQDGAEEVTVPAETWGNVWICSLLLNCCEQ